MNKIKKSQIKTFKCISPIIYHWGVQLKEGEICDIIFSGKKTEKIIFDLESYNMEIKTKWNKNTPPEYIIEKIKEKYSIEIEYNWLTLKGRANYNNFTFIFESENEIKEKYGIDSKCKIHFECSVYHFSDFFDKSQIKRDMSIEDLIGD